MIKKDFSPTLLKDEHILLQVNKHIFAYVFWWGFAILSLWWVISLSIYGDSLESFLGKGFFVWMLCLFALVSFVFTFFLLLSEALDTLLITDKRVISFEKALPFRRETRSIALSDISEIHAKVNGILPTLFWYGTIELSYTGSERPIQFLYAPRASELVRSIHEIKTNGER